MCVRVLYARQEKGSAPQDKVHPGIINSFRNPKTPDDRRGPLRPVGCRGQWISWSLIIIMDIGKTA